jgi:hypothetical protein
MILHYAQTLQVANSLMFVIINFASFIRECFYEEATRSYCDHFHIYSLCGQKQCFPDMAAQSGRKLDRDK